MLLAHRHQAIQRSAPAPARRFLIVLSPFAKKPAPWNLPGTASVGKKVPVRGHSRLEFPGNQSKIPQRPGFLHLRQVPARAGEVFINAGNPTPGRGAFGKLKRGCGVLFHCRTRTVTSSAPAVGTLSRTSVRSTAWKYHGPLRPGATLCRRATSLVRCVGSLKNSVAI